MNPLWVGLCVALPVAIWLAYFRWKDRVNPDPWWMLLTTFVLGMLSACAAIYGYKLVYAAGLTSNPWFLRGHPLMWYSLAVIGPVEEIAKAIPILLVIMHLKRFDEMTDGLLYPAIGALGFSTLENAFYLHQGMIEDQNSLLWRSIAGPVAHMAFATLWGYGLVKWKFRIGRQLRWIPLGFVFAFILHGMYDYATLSGGWYKIFASLLIVVTWIWTLLKWDEENLRLRRAQETGNWEDLAIPSAGVVDLILRRKPPQGVNRTPETDPTEAVRRPEGRGTGWWRYWTVLLVAVPVGLATGYVAYAKNKVSRMSPSDVGSHLNSGQARLAAQDEERTRTLAGLRVEIARLRRGTQTGDLEALFSLLEHAFWEVREESAKALLWGLTDADDPGGAKARREILRSPPCLARLLRGLRLPDPAVRETLCRICGILREPSTRSELERVAKEDRSKAIREAAEDALRRLR